MKLDDDPEVNGFLKGMVIFGVFSVILVAIMASCAVQVS